jgi:hypothetical protein
MSQRLIDLNADLKRLRDEGYSVEVRPGFLLVHHIPYVTTSSDVEYGTLVSTLHMSGETVLVPDTHVMHFIGGHPCHRDGRPIHQITHQEAKTALDKDIAVDRSFSNKPPEGYRDYFHKFSTYSDIIAAPAFSLDPKHDPKKFLPVSNVAEDSIFEYHDTASSRAGIAALTRKLELNKIALIGLGGTGSYILDLVAKTPIREIHLFDGDFFYSHNAFRCPGAASVDDLRQQKFKVDYLHGIYSKMHKGIIAHQEPIHAENQNLLDDIDFAFVSIDGGEAKRQVLQALEARKICYIDCGMGIEIVEGALTGQIRTTTSSEGFRDHVWNKAAITFADAQVGNEYGWNIQIADLNALNASLAVIRWKKMFGFYLDLEQEFHSIYPIDGNVLINAYQAKDGSS